MTGHMALHVKKRLGFKGLVSLHFFQNLFSLPFSLILLENELILRFIKVDSRCTTLKFFRPMGGAL